MNPIERFQQYLRSLEQRLRWKAWAMGAAALALAAFAGTLAGAWMANRYAFSEASLFWARFALFLAMGFAMVFGLVLPWLRATRRRAASEAELRHPAFEQRLATLATGAAEGSPFGALLAEEVLERAEAFPPERLAPARTLLGLSLAGAAGAGALAWLALAGPGPLGYGAGLLWGGTPKDSGQSYYRILVQPGDRKVRAGADLVIEAQLVGFDAPEVRLLARAAGAAKWEPLVMEPKEGVSGAYGFLLAGLSEPLEYLVQAGRVRSSVHRITLVDLPSVRNIRVTYNFPSWMNARAETEDPGGDLRAVEGTEAELLIETSRPLAQGLLVLDDGTRIPLQARSGNLSVGRVTIRKDGLYSVAALDEGEPVRISDDYFIEVRPETPPVVKIIKPGRDARVSPIEEVVVEVEAADDYGLRGLDLFYSVNGGEEKQVNLLPRAGSREGRGSTLIALEDYKLEPGDVIALYASARDARASTRTDIFFIEAQPFEKEFSQSQTSGGGQGEGGGQQTQISQRQKEIIAATWNQLRTRKPPAAVREDAEFLAGVQSKLSEQALSLAKRMQSRELAGTNEEFKTFSREMELASQAMVQAAGQLKNRRWRDALPPEQKALQHLLRAESVFKQIQVAFGQRGGGGGGGGQQRDLESLFDLELDTEKNQYEAAESALGPNTQREREVDEAVKRLEELARRQQQLAEQQRQQRQQNFQQRWAQEMLRREAEELKRRMEELTRGQQQGQQGQQGQQSSSASQSASSSSASGQQGQPQSQRSLRQMASGGQMSDPRLERALKEVERALDDMRRAQQGASQANDPESARRAAERLAEAQGALGGMRRQETGGQMDSIASRAQSLARRQRDFEERLKKAYGGNQPGRPQTMPGQTASQGQAQAEQFANEKQQMLEDYQRLEREMREATRSMATSEREAASRLRDALGEAQQNELGLRMKYSADWIRRGMGHYMAPRERVVTQGLDQLERRIAEAQQAMGRAGGSPDQERAARALERLERARGELNRQMAGSQRGPQQGQQGQGGQRSAQPMTRGEQQQRNARNQQGMGERRGGEYSALNDGTLQGPAGRGGAIDRRGLEQAYAETVRQIEQLRASGAASDETRAELDALLARMRSLDPKRFPGNPELVEALRRGILPELEQLELRLRRQVEQGSQEIRNAGPAPIPPGYEKAVADYYRRLSKGN